MNASPTKSIRPAIFAARGLPSSDGAGVRLTRIIGTQQLPMLDPFLMLDMFGSDEPTDYIGGFPDHPHRGFETVTYMLAGKVRHADNKGHSGVIETGGVQWMTAGRGIVHSEMPEQTEGLMKGFQLWVNLPRTQKLCDPRYQELAAAEIPVETRDGGARVTVIAGTTALGTAGKVNGVAVRPTYLDVRLPADGEFAEPIVSSPDHSATTFMVLFEGSAYVETEDGTPAEVDGVMLVLFGDGAAVRVRAGAQGARFILVSGTPLKEPVAWGGPFVMNTREEVMQAYEDYQAGRF